MKSPKKYREITIETLGLTPSKFTPAGVPMVSGEVLRELSGSDLFGDREFPSSPFLTSVISKRCSLGIDYECFWFR